MINDYNKINILCVPPRVQKVKIKLITNVKNERKNLKSINISIVYKKVLSCHTSRGVYSFYNPPT